MHRPGIFAGTLCTVALRTTYYVYSKMFIGGLNWDTTDGTSFILAPGSVCITVVLNVYCAIRVAQEILHAIRQGRGLYYYA